MNGALSASSAKALLGIDVGVDVALPVHTAHPHLPIHPSCRVHSISHILALCQDQAFLTRDFLIPYARAPWDDHGVRSVGGKGVGGEVMMMMTTEEEMMIQAGM